MPKRIQRKRTKDWRMPAGAVYVGRPSKWGNPFHVSDRMSRYEARAAFGAWIRQQPFLRQDARNELAGKDLACWCPLDQPCHADVLLEIANEFSGSSG